ncbi:MAG: 50S ribosomal protein L30 [Candidatus Eiseniibacteriota bacterium]|jgi:large subunit ribosomal protein L30
MAKKLKITQVRSSIGRQWRQGLTIRALGIRRMHGSVVHDDTPQIRGMIRRVSHLVRVEDVEGSQS